MDTSPTDDVRAALEKIQKTIEATFGGIRDVSRASPTELLEYKAELVKDLKARRDAIAAAKKDVTERYDAAIARHTDRIATLEREIADSRQALEASHRPTPSDRPDPGSEVERERRDRPEREGLIERPDRPERRERPEPSG